MAIRPNRSAGAKWTVRLLVFSGALLSGLVLAEIGLRSFGFEFHLHPTRLEFGFPNPVLIQKYFVQDDDYLWVSKGYDERLAAARSTRPYLVFSGCSCTQRGYFDEPLAATVAARKGVPLKYANLANMGWSSFQGLQQMKRDVTSLEPEVVTIFYGWNDHWAGFGVDDRTAVDLIKSTGFDHQDLRLVQLATKVAVSNRQVEEKHGAVLRVSLEDFRSNIEEMVEIARSHGITPILITAPTSHKSGMEPGFLRARFMPDLSQLVPLHQAYVAAVREIAAREQVVLCDLAQIFSELTPEELSTYILEDGIHFTEKGGERIARILYECLEANDLLPK